MRFIGSKRNIVTKIDAILSKHIDGTEKNFVDLFAGSNIVGEFFSPKYNIISNDIMYFSYIIAKGSLGQNKYPSFTNLKNIGIDDPFNYLNTYDTSDYKADFVTKEYSPFGKDKRMYFTTDNAKRIDFCRNTIEKWKTNKLINQNEYYYLLASLIYAIPFISNTTGTYGAFLKKWDKRAYKQLFLEAPTLRSKYNNKAYNEDAIQLISKLKNTDIVYIDTPYNTRQYPSNYHVLEMIAQWNKPELKGVTGQPNLDNEKSDFAVKRKAKKAMNDLLSSVKAKHIILSYSTDGIIPEKELIEIINQYAKKDTLEEYKFPYRKYKSKITNNNGVKEILFYYQSINSPEYDKDIQSSLSVSSNSCYLQSNYPKGYIKSPLNYIGGKYKLLPQIIPKFPSNISTFIDLFSGGGNVGININADKIIFNDINTKINDFFRYIQDNDTQDVIDKIYAYINKYNLTKTNEAGFKQFREDYNNNPNPIALYTLVSYSFNYQFRFNNQMQYNNTFGKNRSHFSKRMENNLIKFITRLHTLNAIFTDDYFTNLNIDNLDNNSMVYADPPYLITTGSYNDGNRGFVNWTDKQELELYTMLDSLNSQNIKFALSNVLTHKGVANKKLIEWSSKYNIHHLNYTYRNSSHNTKHLDSDEVLITNY